MNSGGNRPRALSTAGASPQATTSAATAMANAASRTIPRVKYRGIRLQGSRHAMRAEPKEDLVWGHDFPHPGAGTSTNGTDTQGAMSFPRKAHALVAPALALTMLLP